jgi:hypothetical protein
MNPIVSRSKTGVVSAVVLLAGLNGVALPPNLAHGAESANPNSCTPTEYRQFDFWIGDSDVFDVNNLTVRVARVRVDRILDSCVLREDHQGANGH